MTSQIMNNAQKGMRAVTLNSEFSLCGFSCRPCDIIIMGTEILLFTLDWLVGNYKKVGTHCD